MKNGVFNMIKSNHGQIKCDRNLFCRGMKSLMSIKVLIYYALAMFYSFAYAPTSFPPPEKLVYCVTKALPIAYLASMMIGWKLLQDGYSRFVLIGLMLSAAADAALVWRQENFQDGYVLFCCAHFAYMCAMYRFYKPAPWHRNILKGAFLVLLIMIFTIFDGNEIRPMIFFYSLFAIGMAYMSFVRIQTYITTGAYFAWAGAQLFILSDFFMALNEFSIYKDLQLIPRSVSIMTYYLGQLGLFLSADLS